MLNIIEAEARRAETAEQAKRIRGLFAKVIIQAVQDALREDKAEWAWRERLMAKAWLEGNSKDFRQVCELANINPDKLRAKWMSGQISRADVVDLRGPSMRVSPNALGGFRAQGVPKKPNQRETQWPSK